MSGTDFDMAAYEADLAQFLYRERNDSAATFGVIDNHPDHSDHGQAAADVIEHLDPIDAPTVPAEAVKLLTAIIDAAKLHPAAGLVLCARLARPEARSCRALGEAVGLGRTSASEAINALRSDHRFKALFPVTGRVAGQQRRRRRDRLHRDPDAMTMCRLCGVMMPSQAGRSRCPKCGPEGRRVRRTRSVNYPR